MSGFVNAMLGVLPYVALAGAAAHAAWLGVDRGWRGVSGLEKWERSAADARERLTAHNEAFAGAKHAVEAAEKQVAETDQRIKALTRDIERLALRPPGFIHTLGEPGPKTQTFNAVLSRDGSAGSSQPVSPVWRYANTLVVHASDRDGAKADAERAFPEKAGYLKVFKN